ncbi:MAG: hypothetical protein ABI644_01185 [Arenimonas sp.]
MKEIIVALLMLTPNLALAEDVAPTEVVETVLEQKNHALGETEVKKINEINSAIQNGDRETAFSKLKPILSQCESRKTEAGEKIIYVDKIEEFLEFVGTSGKNGKYKWVIDYCPRAYNAAAFLYVAGNDKENAFKYLNLASDSAPFWAEPQNERGYFLGKLKDFQAALAAYQKAIELEDKHESSAYVKPMSLRGMGFILTEMGELDAAQKAYENSLVLEPNNELAKNELEYIRQQKAKK